MCWRMSCAVHGIGARRRRRRELEREDDAAHIEWSRRLAIQANVDRRTRQKAILLKAYGAGPNHIQPLRHTKGRMIDLNEISYDAVADIMNALNPGGKYNDGSRAGEFLCHADRQAFSDASVTIADRWSAGERRARPDKSYWAGIDEGRGIERRRRD